MSEIRKQLSRRDFLRASAISAGVLALAACGPAAPAAPAPAAPAEGAPAGDATATPDPSIPPALSGDAITWWYAWANLDPATEKIVELPEFKEMLGNDKFEYRGNVAQEAILTAIAAGTPPDGGSNYDYANFFARGAAIAVDDLVANSTLVSKDNILAPIWDSCFFNGQMAGVPGIETFTWYGLNYNSQAVEAAGLDPDSPPVTWDDCYAWHEAMTNFDDAGNLLQMGLDPYDAIASEPDFLSHSYGRPWWNDAEKTFHLDTPEFAEGLEKCGDFIRLVGPDKFQGMRQVQGQGTWGAAYNAGVQTMIIEGYWHPGETQIQKPELAPYNRATWAPVPESRRGVRINCTGAHMVQIFRDGKHHEGMFKVAEFLLNDSALDIIFQEVGWMFGKPSWVATVDPNTYPGLDFYMRAVEETDEWLIGRRCPINSYMVTQYQEMRERVFRDEMSGAEAAAELQRRAVDEYDAQGLS